MPGRSRRLASVRGTRLKVLPPRAITLDPARIEPQPQGIIIFLLIHLPPRPGIIPLVQIRKESPPLEIMEIIAPRQARVTPVLRRGRTIIIIRPIKREVLVTPQLLTTEQATLRVTNVVAKDIFRPTHHAHNMVNQIPTLDLMLNV